MINLSILTLQGPLYEGGVDYVSVPGTDGWLGVLPDHVPLITALKAGKILVRSDGKDEEIEIERGFMEVRPKSEVVILVATHRQ